MYGQSTRKWEETTTRILKSITTNYIKNKTSPKPKKCFVKNDLKKLYVNLTNQKNNEMNICYCGNHLSYEECCQPYINKEKNAPTAEALMRSRFSAYATHEADYLIETTHVSTRKKHKKSDIIFWSESNKWITLEILEVTETSVHFRAHYLDNHRQEQIHEEKSNFVLEIGNWYYVDGIYF